MKNCKRGLEERLVLYPFREDRFSEECIPKVIEFKEHLNLKEQPRIYEGRVPGRKYFPLDRNIALETYDESKEIINSTETRVRVVDFSLVRTGTGKQTGVSYFITKIKDKENPYVPDIKKLQEELKQPY